MGFGSIVGHGKDDEVVNRIDIDLLPYDREKSNLIHRKLVLKTTLVGAMLS